MKAFNPRRNEPGGAVARRLVRWLRGNGCTVRKTPSPELIFISGYGPGVFVVAVVEGGFFQQIQFYDGEVQNPYAFAIRPQSGVIVDVEAAWRRLRERTAALPAVAS